MPNNLIFLNIIFVERYYLNIGSVEYLFIASTPRFTLTRSGSTC